MRVLLAVAIAGVSAPVVLGGGAKLPPPAESAVVATGSAPCGTAVARGALWVGVYGTGKLLRIDPGTGTVTRRLSVGPSACRVAISGARAWVTRDQAGTLVRVDLRTGRRRSVQVGASPFDVALAAGSLWTTSFDTGVIARLDPVSGTLRRAYKDSDEPAGVAACGGRIWVGHGRSATWLTAIDPSTHRIRRVQVGATAPGWPRCVHGELWVTTRSGALRVDARSGAVLGRVLLGGTPAEAAAGPDGLVWVTDKERSLVHRIAGANGVVLGSFPAGPGAFALARVGGSMWVTSFAGVDVRRYEPR